MSNFGVLDTRFRSALGRMAAAGRLAAYTAPVDPHLEVAAIMKKLDGGPALLFGKVDGYDMPVVGNLLSCQENCEAAFGIDFNGIREFVGRALGQPQAAGAGRARAARSSTSTPRTSISPACCRRSTTPRRTPAASSPPAS